MKNLDTAALYELKSKIDTGGSTEDILATLREQGFSIVESIKAIVELNKVSLRDAKKIVHLSDTWKDLRSTHDSFQEKLEQSVLPLHEKGATDEATA